jgi:hypothetical protein
MLGLARSAFALDKQYDGRWQVYEAKADEESQPFQQEAIKVDRAEQAECDANHQEDCARQYDLATPSCEAGNLQLRITGKGRQNQCSDCHEQCLHKVSISVVARKMLI